MSDFVQIGDVRIKRSNIASFGVATREKNFNNLNLWGAVILWGISKVSKTVEQKLQPTKYLYITTYQKDNYTFTENEIDISATLADLENGTPG